MCPTRPLSRRSLGFPRPLGTLVLPLIVLLAALVPAGTVLAGEPAAEAMADGEGAAPLAQVAQVAQVVEAGEAAMAGPAAEAFVAGRRNPAAPAETEQFGRLVGIWDVTMSIRQDDGSWPKPEDALAAEWRFHYILDGWAVQDEWISPPWGTPVEEGIRQLGTNIRIYDPNEGAWDVAWISNTQQTLSTLTAKADGERIVMNGMHPSGKAQRVTFYDIRDRTFDWTLELQGVGEDPDAWLELARIHGVKRAGAGAGGPAR